MDNADPPTPLSLPATTPPPDKQPLAAEVEIPSSPVTSIDEPAPAVKDTLESKGRLSRTSITFNACTTCRKKRRKCDGRSPCEACSRCSAVRSSTVGCVYEVNARVAKSELQRENSELRKQNALSDQVFHALRSDWQVPNILQLLRDEESLALIAKIANSPSIDSSVCSPSEDKLVASEGLLQQKHNSESCQSPEIAPAPSEVPHPWIAAPCDEHLIKHLFSLYWTWIHPAYLLFNMEQFMEGYKTGNEEHCSSFLIVAVCAAACDLLGPYWAGVSGKVLDVATLRRAFVAEAIQQEGMADKGARTWLEASRVMLIVSSRSPSSCA